MAVIIRTLSYEEIGQGEGAKLLYGGKPPEDPALGEGLFVLPTVFSDVSNDMRIAREEIFGPVACLLRFSGEEEAVRLANDTDYGLAAGVWTNNVAVAHRMINHLRAGTVWVNTYRKTNYSTPFGGFKQSGLGRENGIEVMREYTEVKSAWIATGGAVADPFNPRA
jgi:aldehyde dehydrogenase (NAD+)